MTDISAWFWQFLGSLVGAATLISLVKNGFAIELHGLPAAILRQYTWLRDALFEPVAWALRYLGLPIPWWLKDLVMVYALVAAALWRVLNLFASKVDARAGSAYAKYQKTTFLALSAFWPLAFHPQRRLPTGLVRQAFDCGMVQDFDMMFRRYFYLNLAAVIVTAVAFFVWSHLSNVLGPA